jgi:predicted O-methyltransferase YrrM
MTTLNESLELIAGQVHADARELIAYAAEDNLGGYHWNGALATFKQGSCFGVEGQTLYALIRWLKPDKVAEIGGWAGCSGSHIAAALIKNGKGRLYSVDNEVGGQAHGADMNGEYRKVTTLVSANGQDWLAEQPDESIDLIFEDADHSVALVALLSTLALKKLKAGGILLNHDAAHDFAYDGNGAQSGSTVGREVREGLAQANAYFRVYRAEPSDCGLALTVKPSAKKDTLPTLSVKESVEFQRIGNANIESVSEPPAPKAISIDGEAAPSVTSDEMKTLKRGGEVKRTRTRKPKAK